MTEGVVNPLETVEIEEKQGKAVIVALGLLQQMTGLNKGLRNRSMKIKLLTLIVMLLALTACRTIYGSASVFQKNSEDYNRMLRWQELDKAATTFVTERMQGEYRQRAEAVRDVKIADYRLISQECHPDKGEAEVRIEIDYYRPPSVTLKTVEDVQKWRYVDGGKNGGWRLETLVPEFP